MQSEKFVLSANQDFIFHRYISAQTRNCWRLRVSPTYFRKNITQAGAKATPFFPSRVTWENARLEKEREEKGKRNAFVANLKDERPGRVKKQTKMTLPPSLFPSEYCLNIAFAVCSAPKTGCSRVWIWRFFFLEHIPSWHLKNVDVPLPLFSTSKISPKKKKKFQVPILKSKGYNASQRKKICKRKKSWKHDNGDAIYGDWEIFFQLPWEERENLFFFCTCNSATAPEKNFFEHTSLWQIGADLGKASP